MEQRSTKHAAIEAYAHRKLTTGGSFRVRDLTASSRECVETITKQEQQTISVLEDLQPNRYGIPKARNFAVADAAVLPNRLYQMTVSATHPIKGEPLRSFVKAWHSVELYFVVPERLFDSFTPQDFVTKQGKRFTAAPSHLSQVQQYVLCMPLT